MSVLTVTYSRQLHAEQQFFSNLQFCR